MPNSLQIVSTVVSLALIAGAASAGTILPHRAGYELSLVSTEPGSGILDVTGVLSYDWSDQCDGWAVEQKYALQILRGDGAPVHITASYVNWESKDGKRYRFNVKRMRKSDKTEEESEVKGEAELGAAGKPGKVRFEKPERQIVILPKDTMFPTMHTVTLIAKAEAGERFYRREVFDGAELQGPSTMTAVLLPRKPSPPGGHSKLIPKPLPVWPFNIAVFPVGPAAEVPEFEMTIYMQANGVVPEMRMNYGDFTVKGTLKLFQELDKPTC